MGFTHLHVHTEYSLLDGSNRIKDYVKRVKELGMNSAAITDHGVMYGAIDFYRAAKAEGIKPILGCEVYVTSGSRFDRELTSGEDRYHHLVLLAENNIGYENLSKIVSIGFTEGYYYKPRIDKETLIAYSEGIIALSACLAGEVPRNLLRGKYEEGKRAALEYEEIFGKGNFFLELQDHGMREQTDVNQKLLRLSADTGIELVATNDIHYTLEEDAKPHDVLICLQTGKKLTDEDRMRYEGGQYFVKSESEMRGIFGYAEQAIDNTQKIADRCNVEIEFGVTKMPSYPVPEGYNAYDYLKKLCYEGLATRYPEDIHAHEDRLEYELSVISSMGFVDYFLIVWDFVNYSNENNISVGAGRGSAAGSMVSYCLRITDIDPIKYNLIFERFLNPERVSMPDVDIDFCIRGRQDVIDYVGEKYGEAQVAQIITFGTRAAKGAVRDVGRVLDLPYAMVDNVAKLVPDEPNISLDRVLNNVSEFRELYESDMQIKELIDMSKQVEGLPKNTSMHAAGVVICGQPIANYVPLSKAKDGTITTQFTMNTLEELGLLKMDFLGLRNLTVIQDAIELVARNTGEIIDIKEINYEDKKVYAALGQGKTEGVFQLEGAGVTSFIKELKPECLEDVIAGISLYRPGPMEFIPKYLQGKHGDGAIVYDCPELEPILSPTYGCIVYQEQVMQIVRDLGGYTLGRSDLLRRAMSKKKEDVMIREREAFVNGSEEEGIKGCVANGISADVANKIYDDMLDFAKYAFNKSHAAAYAVVAYQTAYLKYYHPAEYMAAVMSSVKPDKVPVYLYACKSMGLEVTAPDINTGIATFSGCDNKIQYGLGAIKGVGQGVVEVIVNERENHGLFADLQDFITRMSSQGVNKRAIENFIKAGAFDQFEGTRKQQMHVYAQVLDDVNKNKKSSMAGQLTLFDVVSEEEKQQFRVHFPEVGEFEKKEILTFEKEVLDTYLSGHPLEEYEAQWRKGISATSIEFKLEEEDESDNNQEENEDQVKVKDGATEIIGGIISGVRIHYTKNNQTMAFVQVEDLLGVVEVVVFPRNYEESKHLLVEDEKVFIKGRVSTSDKKDSSILCEKIRSFDDKKSELWIQFESIEAYENVAVDLHKLLNSHPGKDMVNVYCKKEKAIKRLGVSAQVLISELLLMNLKDIYGDNCIKVVEKVIEKNF